MPGSAITALCLLVGSIIGAGIILHMAGRKVTCAETDRRELAARRALVEVLR